MTTGKTRATPSRASRKRTASGHRKLWGGRFSKPTDPMVEAFSSSIAVDQRLLTYDIQGSIAHAKMLKKCRIIPQADANRIVRGLERLLQDAEAGRLPIDPSAEDVHSVVQSHLRARIGASADRLHTGRSRNDQVATDMRLWAKDAVALLAQSVRALQRALVRCARRAPRLPMPGYTHLQRAQVVLWGHVWLAYASMLDRDVERLEQSMSRIDVLPLGSAALAGTTLPIDRAYVAKLLGFARISDNSLDAVSDRDFLIELLADLSLVAMHLSRLGEEIVLYASSEFSWVLLDESCCTGSSYMPQKRNPDVAELVRGASGEVYGALVSLLVVLKGLPLSYNRDLQHDKRPVFRAVDTVVGCLNVMALMIGGMRPNALRLARAVTDEPLYATDLAEVLVGEGMPVAEAHRVIGELLKYCADSGESLHDIPRKALQAIDPGLAKIDVAQFNAERSASAKRSAGSTSPASVDRQLRSWERRLRRS